MTKNENDRRVQRTRQLLQRALMELINEKQYESITISDITERANVGRTTFYAHYHSKEELFLSGHQEWVYALSLGALSIEELLGDELPAPLEKLFAQALTNRALYLTLLRGDQAQVILRGMQKLVAADVETKLRQSFDEKQSRVPFTVLAAFIAGSCINMASWWIETRSPLTSQEMAASVHTIIRAVLRNARL